MEVTIGKMISKLRLAQNLNQRELASLLSVSNGTVGMWETGKRQPDLNTVVKIATFFNVSVDYLLGIDQEFEGNNDKLTAEEELLLQLFNGCDEECQNYLLAKAEVLCIEGISAVTANDNQKYIDQGKKSYPSGGSLGREYKKKA